MKLEIEGLKESIEKAKEEVVACETQIEELQQRVSSCLKRPNKWTKILILCLCCFLRILVERFSIDKCISIKRNRRTKATNQRAKGFNCFKAY